MSEIVQFPKPIDSQRGLMNSYPCGCQVRTDGAGCYTIHACPTHAAAPALLAACEGLLDTIDGLKDEWDVVMRSGDLKRIDQAHAALAAARPEPTNDAPGIAWARADARRQDKGESLGEPWK